MKQSSNDAEKPKRLAWEQASTKYLRSEKRTSNKLLLEDALVETVLKL